MGSKGSVSEVMVRPVGVQPRWPRCHQGPEWRQAYEGGPDCGRPGGGAQGQKGEAGDCAAASRGV